MCFFLEFLQSHGFWSLTEITCFLFGLFNYMIFAVDVIMYFLCSWCNHVFLAQLIYSCGFVQLAWISDSTPGVIIWYLNSSHVQLVWLFVVFYAVLYIWLKINLIFPRWSLWSGNCWIRWQTFLYMKLCNEQWRNIQDLFALYYEWIACIIHYSFVPVNDCPQKL